MGQKFRMVANYDSTIHEVGATVNVEGKGEHVIVAVSPIPNGKANFVVEKVGGNREQRRRETK